MPNIFSADNPFLRRLRRHARMPVLLRAAQVQPQGGAEEPAATPSRTPVVRATLAPAPDPADDAVAKLDDVTAARLQPVREPVASPAGEAAALSKEEDGSWRRLQAIARGHRERQADRGEAPAPPPTPSPRAAHVLRREPAQRPAPTPETAPRPPHEGRVQREGNENDEPAAAPVAEPSEVPAGGGAGAPEATGSQDDAGSQSDSGSDIGGRSEIGGNLTVGGSLTTAGDVTVGGSADVGNNMASQEATIGGGASAGSSIQVGNDAEIAGGVDVGGVASVGGDAEISGPVQVGATAVVQGNADVGDTATVGSAAIVQGDLSAGNSAEVGAVARVSGDANVGGPAAVGGAATVEGDANVGQTLTANTATVSGDATVGGEANVGGSATVGGNLNVGGNATISGAAHVAGNMNAGGGITVVEPGSNTGEGDSAQRRPDENVPLESAWPVQRKIEGQATAAEAQSTRIPEGTPGPGPEAAAGRTLSVADAQALDSVRRALENVEAGPTRSGVELVLPRRPRPASPPGSVVQRKAESTPASPDEEAATGDGAKAAAVGQRAVVDTEIGPLPGDLWQLLGQEKPREEQAGSAPPTSEQPPAPASRTARNSVEDSGPGARPPGNDGAQATPATRSRQAPAVQRAPAAETPAASVDTPEAGSAPEGGGPEADIEALARQVFNIVRRQLQVDWERGRGRL